MENTRTSVFIYLFFYKRLKRELLTSERVHRRRRAFVKYIGYKRVCVPKRAFVCVVFKSSSGVRSVSRVSHSDDDGEIITRRDPFSRRRRDVTSCTVYRALLLPASDPAATGRLGKDARCVFGKTRRGGDDDLRREKKKKKRKPTTNECKLKACFVRRFSTLLSGGGGGYYYVVYR